MDIKSRYQNYIITGLILVFGFLIGFGFDRLINSNQATPIIIDKNVKIGLPERQMEFSESSGKSFNFAGSSFVASINGNNYYPSDCPSAKRIKEENMIWFESAQEAETQGYKPAQNCR